MTVATAPQVAVLEDRGAVSVTGPDAAKLLGGLITNDMAGLDRREPGGLEAAAAIYAGLLSPQGKILFDFLVVKTADGFLLDTSRVRAADLVKRLSLYKLRAAVEIRDVSDGYRVAALWGDRPAGAALEGALVFADPRLAGLGLRAIAKADAVGGVAAALGAEAATADAYHAHRIGLGVPEGGRDFAFGDAFPHEALFDQLNGVSFTKGCYVGQEVVSRMQHRASIRKRIVIVTGERALPPGPLPVLMGEVEIGRLGSVAGVRGLALMRLDRVAEAGRNGVALVAGDVPLQVAIPPFAHFGFEAPHEIA